MITKLFTPRFGIARSLPLWLALAFMVLGLPGVAEANLVANGSFELSGTSAPPWTSVPGWAGGGQVWFGPGSIWGLTPPNGNNIATIGGDSSFGAVLTVSSSASFNLTAGERYTFSFESTGLAAYSADYSSSLPWESGKMGINYYFFYDYPAGDPNRILMVGDTVYPTAVNAWTTSTHTVTAPISGPATIHAYLFNNGWSPGANVYLGMDNFSVVAVPEPGALALAGIGVAAAAWAARRRRS